MMKTFLASLLTLGMLSMLTTGGQAEEGKIFGKVFLHYSHDFSDARLNPKLVAEPGRSNGFSFSRVYFGYDADLTDKLSIRFMIDADADYTTEYQLTSTTDSTWIKDSNGDSIEIAIPSYELSATKTSTGLRPFVKNAYLAVNCKLVEGGKWYFGLIRMPFVAAPESHWLYRSVSKLAMDQYGWGNTADLGIGWKGMWKDMFMLEFALVNGAGFRSPEVDMFKLLELRPTAYLLNKSITLTAFGSFETLNSSSDALSLEGMGGYDHKYFRIGAEYAMRSTTDGYEDDDGNVKNRSENIFSAWGHLKPTEKLTLFGRYDHYDPNADLDDDAESRLIGGLDFHPLKNLRLIPNAQMTMFQASDDASTPEVDESASFNTFYLTLEYGW